MTPDNDSAAQRALPERYWVITTPSGSFSWLSTSKEEVAHYSLPGQGHTVQELVAARESQPAGEVMREALQRLADASMVAMTDETSATEESVAAWEGAMNALSAAPKAAAAPEGVRLLPLHRTLCLKPEHCSECDRIDAIANAAADAPPGCKRTPNGWERTGEEEPVFWYRPCGDGLYEGPTHHKSSLGKMLRDEKPGAWVPLYTHPTAALEAQERDAARLLLEVVDQVAGELDADHRPSGAVIRTTLLPRMLAALSAGGRGGK